MKELRSNKNNREIIYDYIRIFACICVIGIHSTNNLLLESISRIGLPMFTFLSGVLILNSKDEKVSNFYLKRIIKIIIPLYFYSIFYIFVYKYNYSFNIFNITNFINELINITKGYVHYHLWYVYMIIGVYFCAPYLKKMCKSLSDSDCKNLVILIFIITILKYTLPALGFNIVISDIAFVGWTLVFLLGYLTTKECIKRNYKLIYFLGLISFNVSIFARAYLPQLTNINDLSITMLFQVMAVYLFFYRNKKKICHNEIINKIVTHLSKYTWEIYLIHVFILDKLKVYIFNLNINITLASIILIILTFFISYISAFIIHNLLIKYIQKLLIKITNKVFKNKI